MEHNTEEPKRKSGRQKGTVALKKLNRERLLGKIGNMSITPLEVMYSTMKDFWDKDEKIAACAIARDLAPYVHPKLTAIQQQIVEVGKDKIADERIFGKLLDALELGVQMRDGMSRKNDKVVTQQTTLIETIDED